MTNNDITDIKEEVYKCSKCGLCKSVCPLYLAVKNENYLPRGRFIILNKYFKNNAQDKLSPEFIKNTDICLNCNECKRFCPSNIDTTEILTKIKYKYHKSVFLFSKMYFLKLNIKRITAFYKFIFFRNKKEKDNKKKEKVLYFEGCYNKYINPSDKIATISILKNLGYCVEKINSYCCGLPYLSEGNINSFNKNSKKIIKSIPDNIKYIVTSCDSCYDSLSKLFQSHNDFSSKLIRLDELIRQNKIEAETDKTNLFHNPINRPDTCYVPTNIEIINRKGICTLMENFFSLKHKKEAGKILNNVFYTKEELEGKTIVTSCQISRIGLEKCIKKINAKTKILSYSEYVESIIKNTNKKDID